MRLLSKLWCLGLTAALAGCGSTDFAGSSAKIQDGAAAGPAPAASPAPKTPGTTPVSGVKEPPASGDAVPTNAPSSTTAPSSGAAGAAAAPIPADLPLDSVTASIDAHCASNASGGGIFGGFGEPVTPPTPPLPKTAPAGCRQAVEMNNFHGSFDLDSLAAAGSRNLRLEVDVATYEAPDRIRMLAVDGSGQERVILDTCRMKTSDYPDPTDGSQRPPADSIRSFRPVLPQGTTALRFDFSGSHTPQYLRVVGLCDFGTQPSGGSPDLRPVTVP